MMEKFTASNGVEIVRQPYAFVIRVPERPDFTVPLGGEEALREFFLAERDAELGRWRWPLAAEYVVYASNLFQTPADADLVHVVNDANGQSHRIHRKDSPHLFGRFSEAVTDYFAAHPVRKPWEDAKPGEVWAVTTANVADEVATQVIEVGGELTFTWLEGLHRKPLNDPAITAARRIWPEAS